MIVADDRETNGANSYFESCISANNKLFPGGPKIEYAISRVTTGDYHIIYKDKIHVSFERKTWKDLAASIKDRRIDSQHRQMESLSADSGTRIIYIIEGSKKGQGGKIGKISITTLETKIRRIVLHGSQVEMSKSAHETAEIIVAYAREIIRLTEEKNETFELIRRWKMNKILLAEKMGMNSNTFRLKFDKNQPIYHFSEEEKKRLSQVLKHMATDIITTIL